jgi:alkanesulfonate monooxygenase SsuD/methylene tetrahydromethanopterin reductase-like flavin-dependent oxidoreductase (luciferase family)
MTLMGYTMMCEQAGPKQLVRDVALAEEAGFDCAVISDHFSVARIARALPVRMERPRTGGASDRPIPTIVTDPTPEPAA